MKRRFQMSYQSLASTGALATVITVVLLAAVPVASQPPTAAAKGKAAKPWTPPRTPDGQPDLEGVWDFRILTPLERPNDLAAKQVLTDEEAAALEKRAAETRVDAPPPPGNPGTYNQFWCDFGTKVADNKRTSLIVDPPDGRLPALTAEGQKRAAARAEAMGRPANGPEDRALYERIYEYACHVRLSLRVGNRGEVSGNAGFTVHDNRSGDQRMTVAGCRLAT
jgi:hypothetical protein